MHGAASTIDGSLARVGQGHCLAPAAIMPAVDTGRRVDTRLLPPQFFLRGQPQIKLSLEPCASTRTQKSTTWRRRPRFISITSDNGKVGQQILVGARGRHAEGAQGERTEGKMKQLTRQATQQYTELRGILCLLFPRRRRWRSPVIYRCIRTAKLFSRIVTVSTEISWLHYLFFVGLYPFIISASYPVLVWEQ